jgi:hypothetical protein
MRKKDVKLGEVYVAKVSNKLVHVRLDSENVHKGWNATNLSTGRTVHIRSAGRLRARVENNSST